MGTHTGSRTLCLQGPAGPEHGSATFCAGYMGDRRFEVFK